MPPGRLIRINIRNFDKRIKNSNLPDITHLDNFNSNDLDFVFLALPHKISHQIVKKIYSNNNISLPKIIDLSADFRINDEIVYKIGILNHNNNLSINNFIDRLTSKNALIKLTVQIWKL